LITFQNPCEILSLENVHKDLRNQAKNRCQQLYQQYFIKHVQEMCPTGSFTEATSRKKRFIISMTLFVIVTSIVGCIGLTGTVVASVNRVSINNIQETLDSQARELDIVSREVKLVDQARRVLQAELDTLNIRFYSHLTDYNNLKETQMGSMYAISYITTRLLIADQILK
jgi:hypothetical protein